LRRDARFQTNSQESAWLLMKVLYLIRSDILLWDELMADELLASVPVEIAYKHFLIAGITGETIK
jgi:hypothetical protein